MGLTNIFDLGDDQLSAHYNIIFPNGIPLGGDGQEIVLRSKTFEVPETGLTTYAVNWHGLQFEKTGSVEEAKTFSLTLRLDKNWNIYTELKRWLDAGADHVTGGRLPDVALRTELIIEPVDIEEGGDEVPTRSPILFHGVKITKLGGLSFDHSNVEPIELAVDFIYVWKEDKPYS
jgi:hypothetical protein